MEQEMATLSTASKPTSLKLPAVLKTQLEQEAQRAGLRINALSDMTASGSGHELGDVRAYFSRLARHRQGLQAKPDLLAQTPLG
ncbi:MAG: hypothetical protein EBT05_09120 [Betaproteobacteria bacterium]|nr:hypothetical protein [Betaproteobacteria bacterium]